MRGMASSTGSRSAMVRISRRKIVSPWPQRQDATEGKGAISSAKLGDDVRKSKGRADASPRSGATTAIRSPLRMELGYPVDDGPQLRLVETLGGPHVFGDLRGGLRAGDRVRDPGLDERPADREGGRRYSDLRSDLL